MAIAKKSAFVSSLAKKSSVIQKAAKTVQGGAFLSDQEVLDLLEVPDEGKLVINAKLTRIRIGVDKNGDAYFSPNYTVAEGEHKGTPFSEFIGLGSKLPIETFEQRVNSVMRILQNLGVDTVDWDYDGEELLAAIEESANELTAAKPGVKVALTRYIPKDESKEHRLNISVMGLTNSSLHDDSDDEDEETPKRNNPPKKTSKPEPEDETDDEPSLSEIGAAADDGDEEAQEMLTALAEEAGLDINDYGPWADLAEALESTDAKSEEESDDEAVASKPAGTKGKADLGDGLVQVTVVSYNEDTNEYVVRDKAKDEYEISADDIQW